MFFKCSYMEGVFVCSSFFVTQNLGHTYDGDDSKHPCDSWHLYIGQMSFLVLYISTYLILAALLRGNTMIIPTLQIMKLNHRG